MDKYSSENQKTISIVSMIVSLLVLIGALLIIFVDGISEWFGHIALKAGFSDLSNEYPLGKILGYGLLPFTPLFLIYLLTLVFGDDRKGLFTVLAGIISGVLIILFYSKTSLYFRMFIKQDEWFYNIGRVYIWYLFPIISLILIFGYRWLEERLEDNLGLFIAISIMLVPVLLIVYPVLIGFIGILISIAIMIVFLIFVAKFIIAIASSSSSGGSSGETIYELTDGTRLKHDYGDVYKDDYGNRWRSDDGGSTFYKD